MTLIFHFIHANCIFRGHTGKLSVRWIISAFTSSDTVCIQSDHTNSSSSGVDVIQICRYSLIAIGLEGIQSPGSGRLDRHHHRRRRRRHHHHHVLLPFQMAVVMTLAVVSCWWSHRQLIASRSLSQNPRICPLLWSQIRPCASAGPSPFLSC